VSKNISSSLPINHPDSERVKRKTFFLLLFLQLLLFLLIILLPMKGALAVILATGSIIFILSNKDPLLASLILSLLIAIVLPHPTGRRLFFKVEEIFPIITLFFFLLATFQNDTQPRPVGRVGKALIAFLIVVIISGVIGLLRGRPKILIWDEAMMFFLWGIYFIVSEIILSEKEMKRILLAIIIASLLVSLYYIYQFRAIAGKGRFCTDQQHIFNFTIPFLFALFLYATRRWEKILAILLMIPMIIAVYVTLTRALWLLIPLTLLFQYFYFIKSDVRQRRIYSYFSPILIVTIISILGLTLLNTLFDVGQLLGGRAASFKILEQDLSLLARVELGQYVMERWRYSPILGVGLADFVRYRYFPALGFPDIYLLDSTYLQLLWKTGILGLGFFLGVIGFSLARAWFILKNGRTNFDKIIGSSIFFSFLALAITGLESAIWVGYRFNLVWATLAGLAEMRFQEIKRTN